jgi:hypothetical protein
MIDKYGHQGIFRIIKKNKGTGEIKTTEIFNAITDLALNKEINILVGTDPDMAIKYLAIGTSATTINNADIKLGTEIFRTQFQSQVQTANNEITTEFTVLDSEAVATWQELGVFCGSLATSTADSGTMLSRILYTDTKTSLEEITIQRIDRIIRV